MSDYHILKVTEAPDADNDGEYEVQHLPTCSLIPPDPGEEWRTPQYDCAVDFTLHNEGLGYSFYQSLETDEQLKVGEYKIEYWENVYPGGPWGATEYDAGLRIVEENQS